MTLLQQLLWGSMFLGVCLIVHIILLAWCIHVLERPMPKIKNNGGIFEGVVLVSIALAIIVFAHTFQVWLWAGVWISYDILFDWNSAIYFSLVTYTTLGYGDIVLGPEVRIFATFASVTGLLCFGLSTAFLVALMARIFAMSDTK